MSSTHYILRPQKPITALRLIEGMDEELIEAWTNKIQGDVRYFRTSMNQGIRFAIVNYALIPESILLVPWWDWVIFRMGPKRSAACRYD